MSWRSAAGGWRLLVPVLLLLACAGEEKPLSEPGERLYPLTGVVVSRASSDNSLRIRHEAIPGYMAAMTMEFPVRGADVATLPPNGSKIEATLHVTKLRFWITDVKAR